MQLKDIFNVNKIDVFLTYENKAKTISTNLLELNLKNKIETEKTRWTGKKREETENLVEKNTKNWRKLDETERNRKKREETGKNRNKQKETGRNSKKQ